MPDPGSPIDGTRIGPRVLLRDVLESDLPVFFEQQRDPDACRMAAFTSLDPNDHVAFLAHWFKILADASLEKQTILYDGIIAGNIFRFELFGEPSVGYWIGKEFWGRGIATAALTAFLAKHPERPLFARAAHDNAASIRVLERCGFVQTGTDRDFAAARGEEIDEFLFALRSL